MVSCTPHKALQCGHSKCSPGTCSRRNSRRFGSPSKRHWLTRHCCESPSAAVKSSSGVILATDSSSLKHQSPVRLTPKQTSLLRLTARGEDRAASPQTQNTVTPRRGAKPAQGRNEINGRGPLGGKDAVYVGFELEQASRSAIRRRTTQLS